MAGSLQPQGGKGKAVGERTLPLSIPRSDDRCDLRVGIQRGRESMDVLRERNARFAAAPVRPMSITMGRAWSSSASVALSDVREARDLVP